MASGREDGERARGLAARQRVDEDEPVPGVEQLVCEVDPADAEVASGDAVGQLAVREPADDLAAEAVVAQEDVADAGDERPGHRPASAAAGTGSRNSSGVK